MPVARRSPIFIAQKKEVRDRNILIGSSSHPLVLFWFSVSHLAETRKLATQNRLESIFIRSEVTVYYTQRNRKAKLKIHVEAALFQATQFSTSKYHRWATQNTAQHMSFALRCGWVGAVVLGAPHWGAIYWDRAWKVRIFQGKDMWVRNIRQEEQRYNRKGQRHRRAWIPNLPAFIFHMLYIAHSKRGGGAKDFFTNIQRTNRAITFSVPETSWVKHSVV